MYLRFVSPHVPSVPFKAPIYLNGAGPGTLCEEVGYSFYSMAISAWKCTSR